MFLHPDYRGGGEGGGGGAVIVIHPIPVLTPLEFTGKGTRFVLLIKAKKSEPCTCLSKIPSDQAVEVIAETAFISTETVQEKIKASLADGNRKSLRDEEEDYIKRLAAVLSFLFCESAFDFSAEKAD
jgi:hypothetical protein